MKILSNGSPFPLDSETEAMHEYVLQPSPYLRFTLAEDISRACHRLLITNYRRTQGDLKLKLNLSLKKCKK